MFDISGMTLQDKMSTMTEGKGDTAGGVKETKEVKVIKMPWFHGKISRERAENLLNPRRDGLFLVRESTNFPGDYTLCVCFEGRVEHYRIIYADDKITIDEEEYFNNLTELVKASDTSIDDKKGDLVILISALQRGRRWFMYSSR